MYGRPPRYERLPSLWKENPTGSGLSNKMDSEREGAGQRTQSEGGEILSVGRPWAKIILRSRRGASTIYNRIAGFMVGWKWKL